MSIADADDLAALERAGRVVAEALEKMSAAVRVGITTAELDEIGAAVMQQHGAVSAPVKYYQFPGATCISLNHEAVHGIPGPRVIVPGDLVKLDVTVDLDGYVADACVTVVVDPAPALASRLSLCAEHALLRAMKVARAGNQVWEIGRVVESFVHQCGFKVLRNLCGHGVGRSIHEPPTVPNFCDRRYADKLTEGMVLTIEPIISASSQKTVKSADGWTLCSEDSSLSAHFEHTLVITDNEPLVLTRKG
jgi:methionyl aminopeptidase